MISFPNLRGAIARGWCAPENSHKVMDPVLAEAIAVEVWKLLHPDDRTDHLPSPQTDTAS